MSVAITPPGTAEYVVRVDIKTESLVMIGAAGFAGVEAALIAVSDGVSAAEPVILEAAQLVLDADNNVQHLRGPGVYIITKPVTAGTAHLFMYVPVRGLVETREVE